MLTNRVCARHICIPQSSHQALSCLEILLSAPQAALWSTSMIAISCLFSSLSSKFPDILYCLIQTEKRQSKPAASEKTEIQPISREFLLLKNEAQSSKDGTKSYFTIPYITISRHDHFERHKEVLPLFGFPEVSEVSSLLSQSPRLPLTLCCRPRVSTIPFHSIFLQEEQSGGQNDSEGDDPSISENRGKGISRSS